MYKGEIKDFPEEVVEKMLYYQEQQGNKRDVSIFETLTFSGKRNKGFHWDETIEGHSFWYNVIKRRDFDSFFEKYPKVKEYTIEDLRDGEVALEFDTSNDSVAELNIVLKKAFPKDINASGTGKFYRAASNTNWTGMNTTVLPKQKLSTFLKQINMKKQTLTRKQLVELHDSFSCNDWTQAIQSLLQNDWKSEVIEIPQTLIDKLLKEGTSVQKAKVREYGIILETPCPYKDGELIFINKLNIWELRYSTGRIENNKAEVYDNQEHNGSYKSFYSRHAPAHGVVLPE